MTDPSHKPTYEELERLAVIANETLSTIDEWLGQASTRNANAAQDAMWRLRRALWRLGLRHVMGNLDWRLSLIEALERSGFRAGEDGDIRQVLPGQKRHEYATGPTLSEYLADLQAERQDLINESAVEQTAYMGRATLLADILQKCEDWPAGAPDNETAHALMVEIPDMIHQAAPEIYSESRPWRVVTQSPDPDCIYCTGIGERYWHTEDCQNDDCALAGGLDDCRGQVEPCPCTQLAASLPF